MSRNFSLTSILIILTIKIANKKPVKVYETDNIKKGSFGCFNYPMVITFGVNNRFEVSIDTDEKNKEASSFIKLSYSYFNELQPSRLKSLKSNDEKSFSNAEFSVGGYLKSKNDGYIKLGLKIPKETENGSIKCVQHISNPPHLNPLPKNEISLRFKSKLLRVKNYKLVASLLFVNTKVQISSPNDSKKFLFLQELENGEKMTGPTRFFITMYRSFMYFFFKKINSKINYFNSTDSIDFLLRYLSLEINIYFDQTPDPSKKDNILKFYICLLSYFGYEKLVDSKIANSIELLFRIKYIDLANRNFTPFENNTLKDDVENRTIKKEDLYQAPDPPVKVPAVFSQPLLIEKNFEKSRKPFYFFIASLILLIFLLTSFSFLTFVNMQKNPQNVLFKPSEQVRGLKPEIEKVENGETIEGHRVPHKQLSLLEKEECRKNKSDIPHGCKIPLSDYYLGIKDGETKIPEWKENFLKAVKTAVRSNKAGETYLNWDELEEMVKRLEKRLFRESQNFSITLTYQLRLMKREIRYSKWEESLAKKYNYFKFWNKSAADHYLNMFNKCSSGKWATGLPSIFKDWENTKNLNPIVSFLLITKALDFLLNCVDSGEMVASGVREELREKLIYMEPIAKKLLGIPGLVFN